MDLNKIPKEFCEEIQVGFTAEAFVMMLRSGEQTKAYALSPQHMKRLLQYLSHQINGYENQHGEIKAEWVNGIASPIVMTNNKKKK
jgi:hypothetical protein